MNAPWMSRRRMMPQAGLVLIDLIVLLLVFSVVATGAAWGLRTQLDMHRRVGEAATRQHTTQDILKQLRVDLASATAVKLAGSQARLSLGDGEIVYTLQTAEDVEDNARVRRMRSTQSLRRTDNMGNERVWPLHGAFMTFGRRGGAPDTVMDVQFTTRQRYDAGDETIQTLETTLVAGGAP